MQIKYTFNEIIFAPVIRSTVKHLFGNRETEIIHRPASYIIRERQEPEDLVRRLILLPPKGYTANIISETNPHPEVRKAKIEVKGGIRPSKVGFNALKSVLKFQYYTTRDIPFSKEEPYPNIGGLHYKEEIKSSKQKWYWFLS